MDHQVLSLFADPRLIGMVLCLGVIGVLRWIDLMG